MNYRVVVYATMKTVYLVSNVHSPEEAKLKLQNVLESEEENPAVEFIEGESWNDEPERWKVFEE